MHNRYVSGGANWKIKENPWFGICYPNSGIFLFVDKYSKVANWSWWSNFVFISSNYIFQTRIQLLQAFVIAFKDLLTNADELCKISAPFGGGISRLRETCGTVSGMVLVIGSLFGYDTPEAGTKKQELYEKTQEIVGIFEKKYGFLTCRELRGLTQKHDNPIPEKRYDNFYKTRPCIELIGGAAEILDEYLKQNKI